MKKELVRRFQHRFGSEPKTCYFSPGRVNIIGGHTDYNGGAVLPFCIDLGIYGAVSFRSDNIVSMFSENMPEKGIIRFRLEDLAYAPERDFANYASGIIQEMKKRGYQIDHGFNLLVYGNLPKGGGLSSSASLSILICMLLSDHFGLDLDGLMMAEISKATENHYIGVNCGIMDQFVIAMGKVHSAIYLETDTLTYEYIPMLCDDYVFLLVNSKTTRKLSESNYNTRQAETRTILENLQKHLDIDHICQLTPADYERYQDLVGAPHLKRRFKHLVDEHERVKRAKQALENQDFLSLGQLLNAAHRSASELYEVSSEKLDDLVALATKCGSIGSKMIGGGFGGSTLNLISVSKLDDFHRQFSSAYQARYGEMPIMTLVKAGPGVHQL